MLSCADYKASSASIADGKPYQCAYLLGRQIFGGGCNQARISEELMAYSDHRLHDFALQHGLNKFVLDDDAVLTSSKCLLMSKLLKELQASQKRCCRSRCICKMSMSEPVASCGSMKLSAYVHS